ncbi:alpha/beta hydrolase [Litorivicinus sp.]|nr:alpha/beta hydrolase [Litorivicinus sp.]
MFDAVVVEPEKPAESAVIWLHGLGASGADFESAIALLGINEQSIRFIFPNAPAIPVTVNGGIIMPGWYDITDVDIARTIDVDGIRKSADRVDNIIKAQIEAGIAPHNILLVGFSQGGAVALYAGVRSSCGLGGVLALSTYWVGDQDRDLLLGQNPMNLPIEIHHGTLDPVVPYALGEAAFESLQSLGYPVTFQAYSMPHSVMPEQLRAIGIWMALILNSDSPTRSKE